MREFSTWNKLGRNISLTTTGKKKNKGRHIVCLKSKKKQDEVFNSAFFCRTEGIFLEFTESINEINTNGMQVKITNQRF